VLWKGYLETRLACGHHLDPLQTHNLYLELLHSRSWVAHTFNLQPSSCAAHQPGIYVKRNLRVRDVREVDRNVEVFGLDIVVLVLLFIVCYVAVGSYRRLAYRQYIWGVIASLGCAEMIQGTVCGLVA
jgi:hypothetical protein